MLTQTHRLLLLKHFEGKNGLAVCSCSGYSRAQLELVESSLRIVLGNQENEGLILLLLITHLSGVSVLENLLLSPCAHDSCSGEQAFVHVLHIANPGCAV